MLATSLTVGPGGRHIDSICLWSVVNQTRTVIIQSVASAVQQETIMEQVEVTPQHMAANLNPKTLTWERLEKLRIKKLGLASNKFCQHFNVLRTSQDEASPREAPLELAGSLGASPREAQTIASKLSKKESTTGGPGMSKKVNSIAPFATIEKPTCGYFFSFKTDNKKVKFGIPPNDLVKWRNFSVSGN